MLKQLGFRRFAYDWRPAHVPTFDTEIEALKRHGIELLAWWFAFDPGDELAAQTLEVFARHDVQPQLWVMQSAAPFVDAFTGLSETGDLDQIHELLSKLHRESLTATSEAQEADRIHELATQAAPYGCRIGLYNHNGWFGMLENQLAIVERLAERGVRDAGIVYNFSHARDELHDDSTHFPELWARIQQHVMAVNVTGMVFEGTVAYPSQGDAELEMLRTIQESGWHGPVGLIAEQGGDAEVTLGNCLTGLDWLAAELAEPGSGGPRPFPTVSR